MLHSHPDSLFPHQAARKQETKLFLLEEDIFPTSPPKQRCPSTHRSPIFPVPPMLLHSPACTRLQLCSLAARHLRVTAAVFTQRLRFQPLQTATVTAAVFVFVGRVRPGGPTAKQETVLMVWVDTGAEQVPKQEE